jgi:hypothetical protein
MAYALFSNVAQVSKPYRTKSEVWRYAEQRGLIVEVGSFEEDPPRRILDMDFAIRECAADVPALTPGVTGPAHQIAQMVAAARINPLIEAAAS